MATYRLSKSKILFGLQCPKRLYLGVHHPELGEISEAADHQFVVGHDVSEVARKLHPGGILIDTGGNMPEALQKSKDVLIASKKATLFEATLEHKGVLVKTDKPLHRTALSRSRRSHLPDVAVQY